MKGIYKITNKATNKFYIGSSSDITKRWREHVKLLDKNTHHSYKLQEAWNDYGAENFVFEILMVLPDIATPKEILACEEEFISTSKCYEDEIGYNVSKHAGIVNIDNDKMDTFCNDKSWIYENILTETNKANIKNNLILIGEKTKPCTRYDNERALSKKWAQTAKEEDVKQLWCDIRNINRDKSISKGRGSSYWYVPLEARWDKYRKKYHIAKEGYRSIFESNDSHEKRQRLMFMCNVFPNSFEVTVMKKCDNTKETSENYALFVLVSWIISFCDISQPFELYLPSGRMRRILKTWLGTYTRDF